MDLRQLKHLIALAELGSYSKACDSVHLSQSALSRSIKQLEQQLGVQLFERGRFGAQLTTYGLLALPLVRGIVAAHENLTQVLESVSSLKTGELAIGAGPYPTLTLVNEVVAEFVNKYPEIRLKVKIDDWTTLRTDLMNNELDLFIADISQIGDDTLICCTALPRLDGMVFCCKDHPLASKDSLCWTDVLDYPFAMPRLTDEVEQFFQTLSRPYGGFSKRLECNSISTLIEVVENSHAISMAPRKAIEEKLATGKLIALNVIDLGTLQTSYGLVTRHQNLSPAALAFREIVMLRAHS